VPTGFFQHAFRRARVRSEDIQAVHDDDLEIFLASLGILRDIQSGNAKCKFCGQSVDIDSIQAIFPDSGSISLVCNREQCLRQFLEYREVSR
jgi:hypothetical protein